MAECENCPSNDKCDNKDICSIENNPLNKVKNIIGVMSGKGGVGKSTISALIAHELNKKGYKVGLMDSDITGPSIPRLLDIKEVKPLMNELGIIPVRTTEGIDVISMNFFVENEEDPVIWRGPAVSGIVKQFWTDVIWGELDYLIIDMPPGTGDVALTVMQSIPITGIVMVSTPQDLVSMIVGKAVNMARKLNIDIIGLIENMSYIICPECSEKIRIFESDNIEEFLNKSHLDLLGEIPMCREIVNISNKGQYKLNTELTEIAENIINKIINNIKNKHIKYKNGGKNMKIAIPNKGSMVNQHFGMSQSFVIATVEDKKIISIEEISSVELAHQHQGLADLLAAHGATVVITGGIGGGAISGLQQNGLKVIKGASGEYTKVIGEYINGTLEDKDVTCNHHGEHHHQ